MGATPSKSRYNHSNLVLEYEFSLNKPLSYPRILEKRGPSLYEFHPDEQSEIFSQLRYIITDGEEKIASKFKKYKRINNIIKVIVSIIITSCTGYVTGAILEYLPIVSVLWILVGTLIFILSVSLGIYALFFTSKHKKKSLQRWRQSIITLISTKALEWQTKSKPFFFSIYYPIHDVSYGRTNKIVNIRGIVRITLGMPKFSLVYILISLYEKIDNK